MIRDLESLSLDFMANMHKATQHPAQRKERHNIFIGFWCISGTLRNSIGDYLSFYSMRIWRSDKASPHKKAEKNAAVPQQKPNPAKPSQSRNWE